MDVSFFLVIAFVLIHFFSKYISLPQSVLRQFISFSAGVGIAYVFIHLWPQVAHSQALAEENISWIDGHFFQYLLYIIALSGLTVFYTMDRLIARAYEKEEIDNPNLLNSALYKSHMGFFALYNAMIGYLLTSRVSLEASILIYFIAFALHFITNDWTLRHHHEQVYDKYGRWILSASIFVGYLIGVFTDFPDYFIGSVESFIAGAMTLNVIKNELPSERKGKLEGFLIGTVSAAVLFTLL